MSKASHLASVIGRRRMAERLGLLPTAVSNAVVRGSFPASWYIVIKQLADEAGVECPVELFRMRASEPSSREVA